MANSGRSKFTILLLTCLFTGTLDAIAALLLSHKTAPSIIFQYIASGWFGESAFKGGTTMVLWGILFHYLIAATFSIAFFLLYPVFIRALKNKYVVGIIYGAIIFFLMNFAVLPLTHIPKGPAPITVINILRGLGALILCVGLPVSLMANRYYNGENVNLK